MKEGATPRRSRSGFDLPLFQEQSAHYALRFTCEQCSYFVVDGARCSHGYPNHEHLAEHYRQDVSELVFCKEFELR
jgi:hypothetical protein